jgi:2-desacetyl-2-hydroxyethyl bacteriochlorophyllide A dehydrogenase
MTTLSRAARLTAPGTLELQQHEVAEPAAGEVRVRLEGCGVCGSNLPVWEGRPWFRYPLEPGSPGHEGWGTIDRVGAGVQDFRVGDRVALLGSHSFAEHDCAAADTLVRLPPQLAGKPFPGEPLACAMNIFNRSDVRAGQTVAIVGVGFLGAVLTRLASAAGARVVALSRRRFALEVAESCGAASTIQLEDTARAAREAHSLVNGGGYERVIECIGSQEALDLASDLAGTRARLVIAGYHQDGPRRVDLQQWNWRGLDVINAHERDPAQYRRGMQEAVDLVVAGHLEPWSLFTHQFPLAEAAAAFQSLVQRPQGFLKALVLCE